MITQRDNTMGTDGFEFVEYTAEESYALARPFDQMGFVRVGRHRHKDVILYRQGEINFIVNHEPDSYVRAFARVHGPSVCAIDLRVQDAVRAIDHAVELGAEPGIKGGIKGARVE